MRKILYVGALLALLCSCGQKMTWKRTVMLGSRTGVDACTAEDVAEKLGVIDGIVQEKDLMANLRKAIVSALAELSSVPVDELVERRYAKFTAMGRF